MLASAKPSATGSRFKRLFNWFRRHWYVMSWIVRVAILLAVVLTARRIFISIEPGHAGVRWRMFHDGTEPCRTFREGLRVIPPWDRMYIYDIRTQQLPFSTVLYSQDGLEITTTGSLRYHLNAPLLSYLQTDLGPDYENKLLRPLIVSALRKVLGDFSPHQIYSEDEKGLLQRLRATLDQDLKGVFRAAPEEVAPGCRPHASGGYLFVEEFLLLEVSLPKRVQGAIQYKLEQEQYAQAYQHILQREKDERARRVIEAEGIRKFQELSGIPILKWRGIEATEKLAASPNAKFILAGTGTNQLPVLLSEEGAPDSGKQRENQAKNPIEEPGKAAPGPGRWTPPPRLGHPGPQKD